jgi:ATP-dependent RNA helicase RhlB
VEVSVTPEQITVDEVTQSLFHVEKKNKFRLLLGIIERIDTDRFLIFSNTKRGVNMVAERLSRNGISAQALSGDVPQRKRLKVVERFMKGEIDVVVATDVASRGLHIEDVGCVINYDLPQNPEDYVHRIGRTARAGKTGIAVSIVGEDDAYYLEPVESFIGSKIPFTMASADDLGVEKASSPRKKSSKRSKRRGGGSYSSRSSHDTA